MRKVISSEPQRVMLHLAMQLVNQLETFQIFEITIKCYPPPPKVVLLEKIFSSHNKITKQDKITFYLLLYPS